MDDKSRDRQTDSGGVNSSSEEEGSNASSIMTHCDVSFDINHFTDADLKSSTVRFLLENAATGFLPVDLEYLLQNMKQTHLSSIIKLAYDGDDDTEESAFGSMMSPEDLIGGIIAAISFGVEWDCPCSIREKIDRMLCSIESVITPALNRGSDFIFDNIYLLVNERVPYIPNRIAAQTLASILARTKDRITTQGWLLVLVKLQFIEDSENHIADDISKKPQKKRCYAKNKSSKMTSCLRKVVFVKPEEEVFVPFQDTVQKIGEEFFVQSQWEGVVLLKETEKTIPSDDSFALPMLVQLSKVFSADHQLAIDIIIEKLMSYED